VIVLTVLSYNGVPSEPLSATFDELGGTIGRSDNNQLVLADPERTISRVHARVVFRASGFAIVDNGSNPIVVNGQPVGSGREHPLREGDEVQIGGYLLKAGKAGGVPASDPFADLFGDAPMGLAGPAAAPSAPAAPRPSAAAAWPAAAPPWAPVSAPVPPAPAPAPPAGAFFGANSGGPSAIPDDWDPFGADPPAPSAALRAPPSSTPPPAASAGTGVGAFGVAGTADPSLDDLFGLGPAATGGGAGDLLQALSAPTAPAPGHAASGPPSASAFGFDDAFDPAFDKPRARRGAGSLPDHVSELNTPMPLPHPETTARVRPDTGAVGAAPAVASFPAASSPPPVTPAAPSGPEPAAVPAGAILSWEDPPRDGRVVTLPGVFVATAASASPATAPPPTVATSTPLPTDFGLDLDFEVAPGPAPTTVMPPLGGASMAPVLPASAALPIQHDVGAPQATTQPSARLHGGPPVADPPAANRRAAGASLQSALLEGLGVPGLRVNELDEVQMHLLGQLLREAVRGTVELLVARAALKRELRAEVTMIVARENNPLKFSPTVEVALQHLLGAPTPGFMAPAAAMRDAFDDLRAHQIGVMAGMRAALEGVLGRFDPQQLEGKLTRRSAIDSLIPATRKARLWEAFQELFAQLQREAQDDFDELFGRAFLQAYEAQLDRLHNEGGPR
jgi:type VI secretion system FHA domain protein